MNNQEFNDTPVNEAPANSGKGFSVASLVLGIVAAVFAWFGWFSIVALVCGIIGIILSVKGKKLAKASGVGTGLATAGLVLSIIGTVFAGIGFISCFACAACIGAATETSVLEEALNGLN